MSAVTATIVKQVIVVNDGSTDDTLEIVQEIQQRFPMIEIMSHRNMGQPASRNVGLAMVNRHLVCFLDADDRLLPFGLLALSHILADYPAAIAAFGAVTYIDENSRVISKRYRQMPTRPIVTENVLQSNFIDTMGAMLFRTESVNRAGRFDPSLKVAEDWEFYTRASLLGPIVPCSDPVVEYRQHDTSMMSSRQLCVGDFEAALSKVFSPDGPIALKAAHLDFARLEVRRRASIVRRIGHSSKLFTEHVVLLQELSWLFARSRGDLFVAKVLARACLTAGKKILLNSGPLILLRRLIRKTA